MRQSIFIVAGIIAIGWATANTLAQASNTSTSQAQNDILIADFEGDTYGNWKATGDAFGDGPAQANVRPGNRVTGHQGQGLVNTHLRQRLIHRGHRWWR